MGRAEETSCPDAETKGAAVTKGKRISRSLRRTWADPEKREQWIKALRDAAAKPESRKRKRDSWTPERREQASQNRKELWGKPEVRRKLLMGLRRAWADPERRKRWAESIAKAMTPGVRKKQAESLSRTSANPERRNHLREIGKAVWANPTSRKRTLRAQRRAAARPEGRARKSEATKRLWIERNKRLAAADRILAANWRPEDWDQKPQWHILANKLLSCDYIGNADLQAWAVASGHYTDVNFPSFKTIQRIRNWVHRPLGPRGKNTPSTDK
jgi:hypothetical protein